MYLKITSNWNALLIFLKQLYCWVRALKGKSMDKERNEEIWTKIERQQTLLLEIESKLSSFGIISSISMQIDLLKNNYKCLLESLAFLKGDQSFESFTHEAYSHCQHNLTNYFASVGICVDVIKYQIGQCKKASLKKAIENHIFFTYIPIIYIGKALRNHSTHRSNLDFILRKEINHSSPTNSSHDIKVFFEPTKNVTNYLKSTLKKESASSKHPVDQLCFSIQQPDFLEMFHKSFLEAIQGVYTHIKKEFLKHESDEVQVTREIVHEIRAIEEWFINEEFTGENIEKKLSPITTILEELNRSNTYAHH